MSRVHGCAAGLAIIALSGCHPSPADQSARAVAAVRVADSSWEQAFSQRDTTAAVEAVESTGSVLAPNAPIYSIGTYELSFTDPKGRLIKDHGKYVTIWHTQADGSWKVALDIFNSDLPLPAS